MLIIKCTEADIERTGAFYDRIVKWLDDHTNYPRCIYSVYPSEASAREKTGSGSQLYAWRTERS